MTLKLPFLKIYQFFLEIYLYILEKEIYNEVEIYSITKFTMKEKEVVYRDKHDKRNQWNGCTTIKYDEHSLQWTLWLTSINFAKVFITKLFIN